MDDVQIGFDLFQSKDPDPVETGCAPLATAVDWNPDTAVEWNKDTRQYLNEGEMSEGRGNVDVLHPSEILKMILKSGLKITFWTNMYKKKNENALYTRSHQFF